MKINRLHPLDPLNKDEIQKACDILKSKQKLNENYHFACVRLEEPHQDDMLDPVKSANLDRMVFLCVFDSKTNDTFEAVINLSTEQLLNWQRIDVKSPPYGQPPILLEEFTKTERIVKADKNWQDAMKRRGLTDEDIKKIQVDPFSAGSFGFEEEKGKRLVQALCYYRENINDNGYARPIEGVVAIVDLINEKVFKLIDDGKHTPIPKKIINYDSDSYPHKREGLKPLSITQPAGPSFTVNGWEVTWQNWKLHLGFTPREGLVLNQVSYNDEGKERSIIYRASVTDMLVPYGDPGLNHFRKSAFDAGEYGLGTLAGSLTEGCDCKGLIKYFDVSFADEKGNAFTMQNIVCLHEEDAGTLWKHNDSFRGAGAPNEVRRSRELVISFFPTVGNYDYGFYWRLRQDGSLRLEVKLTGIVQTAAVYPNVDYEWGSKLTPELGAPFHQHFFNVRLHMMVDGKTNSFSQSEFTRIPVGANNPYGTAFGVTKELFTVERACNAKAKTQRSWTISNPAVFNAVGQPTAYKLEIEQMPLLLADQESYIAKRGGFANHHVWVTPYDPKEKYAAGDYPNQHQGGNGLPSYIQQKRNINDTALTMWVTFGPTHAPRPEEFPVMPVAVSSLLLKPFGFFAKNPAMDLPRENGVKSENGEQRCCRMTNHS